jgi:hypothetical protein
MNVKRKAATVLSDAANSSPTSKRLRQGALTSFFGGPQGGKTISTGPKVQFDKNEWIQGLTPNQKDLLKYKPII